MSEQTEEKQETEPSIKDKFLIKIIDGILLLIVALVLGGCIKLILYVPPTTPANNEQNVISKETFQGQWAFNADTVEVHHVWVSKPSNLDGAKVIIHGKEYALTHNITDLEFLPYKYWKDGEMKKIEGYGEVCKDLLVETNVCKISLLDTISYIDTLPTEN